MIPKNVYKDKEGCDINEKMAATIDDGLQSEMSLLHAILRCDSVSFQIFGISKYF